MISAIPIGKKTPILQPTTPTKMKINPLIEKRVAAVLYDFELLDGLLFTMNVHIAYCAVHRVYFMFLW